MIGGKRFKTLREAKVYERECNSHLATIYNLKGKVYKYFVGTHIQWLNM